MRRIFLLALSILCLIVSVFILVKVAPDVLQKYQLTKNTEAITNYTVSPNVQKVVNYSSSKYNRGHKYYTYIETVTYNNKQYSVSLNEKEYQDGDATLYYDPSTDEVFVSDGASLVVPIVGVVILVFSLFMIWLCATKSNDELTEWLQSH